MPGAQCRAGVLVSDGSKLSQRAKDQFIDAVIAELNSVDGASLGLGYCELGIPLVNDASLDNLRDPMMFPDFHKIYLDDSTGLYTLIAKMLDTPGGRPFMPSFVFDPFAMFPGVNFPWPFTLDQLPTLILDVPDLDPEFAANLPDYLIPLPSPFPPEIPPLPPDIDISNWQLLLDVQLPPGDLMAYFMMFFDFILNMIGQMLDVSWWLENFPPTFPGVFCPLVQTLLEGIDPAYAVQLAATKVLIVKTTKCVGYSVTGACLGLAPIEAGPGADIVGLMGTADGLGGSAGAQEEAEAGELMNRDILKVRGIEKTSVEFRRRLVQIADQLSMNPDHIAAVIALESAGTFSPTVRCSYKGDDGVGLLQWPSWILAKIDPPRTTSELLMMTATEQLDVVKDYFTTIKNNIWVLDTFSKVSIACAAPNYLGIAGDPGALAIDRDKDPKNYNNFKRFDKDGDGKIYIRDLMAPHQGAYGGITERISVDDDTITTGRMSGT